MTGGLCWGKDTQEYVLTPSAAAHVPNAETISTRMIGNTAKNLHVAHHSMPQQQRLKRCKMLVRSNANNFATTRICFYVELTCRYALLPRRTWFVCPRSTSVPRRNYTRSCTSLEQGCIGKTFIGTTSAIGRRRACSLTVVTLQRQPERINVIGRPSLEHMFGVPRVVPSSAFFGGTTEICQLSYFGRQECYFFHIL